MIEYNINFPEEIFTGNIRKDERFHLIQQHVMDACKKDKILFCGIARNAGDNIERNIQRIHKTGAYFNEYKVFIYENNSIDNTKEILKEYESDNFIVYSEDIEDANYSMTDNQYNRCMRIADARNKYMDFVQANAEEYPIVAILDLDLIGGWSYEGFIESFSQLVNNNAYSKVAGMTSYGVISTTGAWENIRLEEVSQRDYKMYDSFAFRPYGWAMEEKDNGIKDLNKIDQASFNDIERPVANDKVFSNFGGIALYQTKLIKDVRYSSRQPQESNNYLVADSEHVCFHREIFNKGFNIRMCNRMLVSYSPHRYTT